MFVSLIILDMSALHTLRCHKTLATSSLIIPTLELGPVSAVDKQAPREVGPGQNLDLDGK